MLRHNTAGVYNIATGLLFDIPMPVQPMKAIAAVAIAQPGFDLPQVMAAGIFVGAVVLLLGATRLIDAFHRCSSSACSREECADSAFQQSRAAIIVDARLAENSWERDTASYVLNTGTRISSDIDPSLQQSLAAAAAAAAAWNCCCMNDICQGCRGRSPACQEAATSASMLRRSQHTLLGLLAAMPISAEQAS